MQNLCIIPAKLTSRRLPNKNIKLFFNKPVISYSIKTAIKSRIFSKIFVSTDSEKIANISKKYGADVDFLRPKNLSKHNTTLVSVVDDVIKKLEKKNQFFNFVCCFLPIAPLIKVSHLKKSLTKLIHSKLDFNFPANTHKGSNQYFFYLNKKDKIVKVFKKNPKKNVRKIYSDAGQFYWAKSSVWKKKPKEIIEKNKSGVIVTHSNFGIDVNTLNDWNLLKKKFKG